MKKRKRTRRDWPAVLSAQASSGMSIAAFCRQQGIAASLFYSWRRRDPATSCALPSAGFVELHAVDQRPRTCGITVVSASGWRLELARDFDATTLQRVLVCVASGGACSP